MQQVMDTKFKRVEDIRKGFENAEHVCGREMAMNLYAVYHPQ